MKTKEAIKKIKDNIENSYFRIDIGFGFTSVINGFSLFQLLNFLKIVNLFKYIFGYFVLILVLL